MTFGAVAARYIEGVKPGEMGPTPGKVTVMMAEGLKEGRRSKARSESSRWASIAMMPREVQPVG